MEKTKSARIVNHINDISDLLDRSLDGITAGDRQVKRLLECLVPSSKEDDQNENEVKDYHEGMIDGIQGRISDIYRVQESFMLNLRGLRLSIMGILSDEDGEVPRDLTGMTSMVSIQNEVNHLLTRHGLIISQLNEIIEFIDPSNTKNPEEDSSEFNCVGLWDSFSLHFQFLYFRDKTIASCVDSLNHYIHPDYGSKKEKG